MGNYSVIYLNNSRNAYLMYTMQYDLIDSNLYIRYAIIWKKAIFR